MINDSCLEDQFLSPGSCSLAANSSASSLTRQFPADDDRLKQLTISIRLRIESQNMTGTNIDYFIDFAGRDIAAVRSCPRNLC